MSGGRKNNNPSGPHFIIKNPIIASAEPKKCQRMVGNEAFNLFSEINRPHILGFSVSNVLEKESAHCNVAEPELSVPIEYYD